ncbi:siderophore ABC transporter substrate-binding protein [Clostridium paraputrificum]|uniref:siderophore ABC transporter substrate-binding protein n=1 Tax=Clostridium TaxID=1485 RepID=UPI003D3507FF
MNKKVLGIVIAAAVVLVGGAFYLKNGDKVGSGNNGGAVEVTHKLGTTALEKTPERVVVLDYGALDILDNLGVNIVGVPKSGKLPEYMNKYSAEEYANVGTVKEPDLEAIHALNPDVIVMAGRMEDYYKQFTEIAPTVFFNADGADYLNSYENNLNMLGKLFGLEKETDKMLKEVTSKIEEANKEITKLNLNATSIMLNGRNISAFNKSSRYGLLFNELGFKQTDEGLEDSTHGQEVSYEYLVEKNPEYLFVVDRNAITGTETGSSAKEIIENELVKQTKAYKDGNIVYLNSVNWYTVSGGYTSTLGMVNEVLEAIK